jgi:hypothetical protein
MKKLLVLVFAFASIAVWAQEKKPAPMFVGGSVDVSFGGLTGYGSSSSFRFGLQPQVGYTLGNIFDVGALLNYNYQSSKYYNGGTIKERASIYGIGAFTRIHFARQFFAAAQPEFNITNVKVIDQNSGNSNKYKYSAPSFLIGGGYGGRNVGEGGFFTTIMIDVLGKVNSPYVQISNGIKTSPIIYRATFIVYLKKKNKEETTEN